MHRWLGRGCGHQCCGGFGCTEIILNSTTKSVTLKVWWMLLESELGIGQRPACERLQSISVCLELATKGIVKTYQLDAQCCCGLIVLQGASFVYDNVLGI